ncbi:MAG: hypothetical protein ACRD0F_00655, partial [Acidimicrobiales bacterium]
MTAPARVRWPRAGAAALCGLAALLGGCSSGSGPPSIGPSAVPFLTVDPASPSPTDREIARVQDGLRQA